MTDYGKIFEGTLKRNTKTPQSLPMEGYEERMVENNAGGYVFDTDLMTKVKSFILFGTEGGTYYVNERELTMRNAGWVLDALTEDGPAVVQLAESLNVATKDGDRWLPARAARKNPAIFVLALARVYGDEQTRLAMYDVIRRGKLIRTLSQMYQLLNTIKQVSESGKITWSSGFKKAIEAWLDSFNDRKFAMQAVKYRGRSFGKHRITLHNLMRMVHPRPMSETRNILYDWVGSMADEATSHSDIHGYMKHLASGAQRELDADNVFDYAAGFSELQFTDNPKRVVELIANYGYTWEMIPNSWYSDSKHTERQEIWKALLGLPAYSFTPRLNEDGTVKWRMPMTALIRNLPRLGSYGLLPEVGGRDVVSYVIDQVTNEEAIIRAGVHPIRMLQALRGYGSGYNRNLNWDVNPRIVDALDDAFYLSFGAVEPTNKRVGYFIDVSGSMGWNNCLGLEDINARDASAVLTMVLARREPEFLVRAFQTNLTKFDVTPRMTLNAVIDKMSRMDFGGTDCSLPMSWAYDNNIELDAFVILTDNETWAGGTHPTETLRTYRDNFNRDAKLVVVGMASNGFSIADPLDPGTLDVVGFDAQGPDIINNFIRG